jgi:hypothetical protein
MRKAVIRLGPKPSAETLFSDARRDGPTESGMRTLYDSMRLAPDAPLLVDHDPERVVGRVVELIRWDDVHPLAPWLAARVVLDDGAAEWVRQGTPASLGYATMFRVAGLGDMSQRLRHRGQRSQRDEKAGRGARAGRAAPRGRARRVRRAPARRGHP